MSIKTKIMAFTIGLLGLMPAHAQKMTKTVAGTPMVETVIRDTVEIGNKVSRDVSLRTFQFLNGNNLTALGVGFGKNKNKTYAYVSPLSGYDFANKRPWIGAFGFLDRKYKANSSKVWLSQELYGEFTKAKGFFDSKITYTPIKFNSKIAEKINLSFDTRFVVHINGDGCSPQIESLTTLSGQINKKLSGYALLQTYDTRFKKGSIGINGGVVINL